MGPRLVIALCALAALAPLGALAATSEDRDAARGAAAGDAHASATAYERSGSSGERGRVGVEGNGERTGAGTRAYASTAGGRGVAEASARASSVNLFSGLVTASSVAVFARAERGAARQGGEVSGLAIEGRPVGSPSSPADYDLNGYGTLVALGRRDGGVAGLQATLTKPYKGHAAGSQVTVAFAAASARDATRRPRPPRAERPRTRPRPEAPRARRPRARQPRERAERPRRARRREAPELVALRTGRGYAFPVHGRHATFSNDWGAPRQHTGRHQGTDIFAPAGTPVLAVTDGVLYRVGTRAVSGNRLWLRNRRGDTFFYAHLSAFSDEARNGKRVRAGDVLGFVGSTGDAERTPPHLHFEVHPRDGEAVNPYPFLLAWRERRDVPSAAWLARYGNDPGARPGALVVVRDLLERG